jgi:outer membrane protein TolC
MPAELSANQTIYLNANMKYKKIIHLLMFIVGCGITHSVHAQNVNTLDTSQNLTLDQCIQYAMKHQPALNQALLGVPIARTTNAINLSGWLPQVNIGANLTHYNSLPTAVIPDTSGKTTLRRTGVNNTVAPVLSVTQAIFSPQLIYAKKGEPLVLKQAEQNVDSSKIGLVVAVSKAFYNLLLTLEQIDVLKEDTARLARNQSDTYHQFVGGIVDETDYDEATITLNNSRFQLRQVTENINPQYSTLKQAMGFPPDRQFNVLFDTLQMMQDIVFDTTRPLQFEDRIEFKQLQNQRDMQHLVTGYYHNAWLPTLGAFFDYNYEFENNSASQLFSTGYPYSYLGLSLSMPIFTGFARVQNERRSRLQEQQLDWGQTGLRSEIYTEYSTALANYKSNLYNYKIMQDNESLARKVYFIVELQYKQGVVAYLNVITAESNLITAEIGYTNALFQLLSSKIDLEKAMGIVPH